MFDPNYPANNSPATALGMRNQFNGLKSLIDAVPVGRQGPAGPSGAAGPAGINIAIGGVYGWMKNLPGVPALGSEFVECNGQVLDDAASPLDGISLPDLNVTQRFLRGATTSGVTGGNDSHAHQVQDLDGDHSNYTSVNNSTNDVNVLVPGAYTTQDAARDGRETGAIPDLFGPSQTAARKLARPRRSAASLP